MPNARLAPIDAMKGFAIFLVIMGHIFSQSLGNTTGVTLETLAMIHMPLFVVLSGYFSTKALDLSPRGITRYWWAKVLRLLLPLIAIPTLYQYTKYGSLEVPMSAIFQEYWFTYTLFIIFILFYGFRLVTDLLKRHSTERYHFAVDILASAIAIILVEVGLSLIDGSWASRLQVTKCIWLYKYLILGYLLGAYRGGDRGLKGDLSGALLGLIFALLLLVYYVLEVEFTYGVPSWHIQTPIAISAVGLCYYIAHKLTDTTQPISRAMIYLGRYSLPIYLTHYFFLPDLEVINNLVTSLFPDRFSSDLFIAIVGTLWVLVPTLIVVRWVSSNPYLALLIYGEPLPKKPKATMPQNV